MKTVSFYSYKGGAGRSTTAINTVYSLIERLGASPEHPIVIVDTDVDSAGTTFLFGQHESFNEKFSLQALLATNVPNGNAFPHEIPMSKHIIFQSLSKQGARFGVDEGTVLFLGCDISRRENLYNLNERQLRNLGTLKRFFERYGCSALIFDTPAGTQQYATESIFHSDVVVCCMRPTFQFRRSTRERLREIFSDERYRGKSIILCPTAVPTIEFIMDGDTFPQTAEQLIREEVVIPVKNILKEEYGNKLCIEMLDSTPEEYKIESKDIDIDVFGIPEIERFKWREGLLNSIERLENYDEKIAADRFSFLAALIASEGNDD